MKTSWALLAGEEETSRDRKLCSSIFADKAFWVIGEFKTNSAVMDLDVDTWDLYITACCETERRPKPPRLSGAWLQATSGVSMQEPRPHLLIKELQCRQVEWGDSSHVSYSAKASAWVQQCNCNLRSIAATSTKSQSNFHICSNELRAI